MLKLLIISANIKLVQLRGETGFCGLPFFDPPLGGSVGEH